MAENKEVGVAPGTVPPAKTAADLRKLLRAKVAATLQAHQKLAAAQASLAQATAHNKQCLAALNAMKMTCEKKEQEVRDFLDRVRQRHSEWRESVEAQAASSLCVTESSSFWHTARTELAEAVGLASVPELEGDDTLGAAKYMTTQLAPPRAPAAPPTQPQSQAAKTPLSAPELALVGELWDAVVTAGIHVGRCLEIAPTLQNTKLAVETGWRPAVAAPVRPTEEEVQRYLKQTEEACFDRLKVHHEYLKLCEEKRTVADALSEAARNLRKVLDATAELLLRNPDEVGGICHAANLVITGVGVAQQSLDKGHTVLPLDSQRSPSAPSKRQVGQIAELRKLMRNLAYAKAHCNEARAAQRAHTVTDEVFRLTGISACHTWAECLQWRAAADTSKLEIERRNKARREKAELLASLVAQYEQDVEDASKVLYRYVVTILPAPESPPCDEMRCMLNAASLTYDRRLCLEDKRNCDFPIY